MATPRKLELHEGIPEQAINETKLRSLTHNLAETGPYLYDPLTRLLLRSPRGQVQLPSHEALMLHSLLVYRDHLLPVEVYTEFVLRSPISEISGSRDYFAVILAYLRKRVDIRKGHGRFEYIQTAQGKGIYLKLNSQPTS